MTTKRAHSTSPEPSAKLARAPDSQQREVLCTLPPTCSHSPTRLAGALELEKHYATYHAHVCEDRGCGCVFPDARLLELVSAQVLFAGPWADVPPASNRMS